MSNALNLAVRIRDDFDFYSSEVLRILAKDGELVPLAMNSAQREVHRRLEEQRLRTGRVRAIILKGRQQGISTYVQARFRWKLRNNAGRKAYVLTHEDKATANLYAIFERFHEHEPARLRPSLGGSNARETWFDRLDCRYAVATAGSKETGRSGTAQYFHGCLAPDTPIIDGRGGVRPMEDFALGDLVRTHTGALAPVSAISRQRKSLRPIRLRTMAEPLRATDEHRFWTHVGWRRVSELAPGMRLGFPVARVEDAGVSWSFRLPECRRPQGGGSQPAGPDRVVPDYAVGRMLGLYLAEGCVKRQRDGTVASVTLTVHEREAQRTTQWLEPLAHLYRSISVRPRAGSKAVAVHVYGASFAAFVLARCGELDAKALPQDWRECGEPFVRGLIHGYLAGDGHSSRRPGDRRIRAPSIRSAIAYGMRDALASLGYGWACVSYRPGAVRSGRNERAQWTLSLCGRGVDLLTQEIGWAMPARKRAGAYGEVEVRDGYAWLPIVEIGAAADGDVMDFEVDHPDHSYCVAHAASHNSEVAFWPNAASHFAGLGQVIPDADDTEIILESTANGRGNEFHKRWQQAESGASDYTAIFIPWLWQPEYRRAVGQDFRASPEEAELMELHGLDLEQVAWRRAKIASDFGGDVDRFKQEYPLTAAEAFIASQKDSEVDPRAVARARKAGNEVQPYGPLVIGVDPATSEHGDRFVIAWRRGRVALKFRSSRGLRPMEAAGRLVQIIETERPTMVFIEGDGTGFAIYDRLVEMGFGEVVTLVKPGGAAADDRKYKNKRAECWGLMADWFANGPVRVPDSDELEGDLLMVGSTRNSNGQLVMEAKERIKEREGRSPDLADALAMTFAEPVRERKSKGKVVVMGGIVLDEEAGY